MSELHQIVENYYNLKQAQTALEPLKIHEQAIANNRAFAMRVIDARGDTKRAHFGHLGEALAFHLLCKAANMINAGEVSLRNREVRIAQIVPTPYDIDLRGGPDFYGLAGGRLVRAYWTGIGNSTYVARPNPKNLDIPCLPFRKLGPNEHGFNFLQINTLVNHKDPPQMLRDHFQAMQTTLLGVVEEMYS